MNSIKLKDYGCIINEIDAIGIITPGMVLELTSANKVQAHSVASGDVMPYVALEDELQGNDIDDDYAVADRVQVWIPGRGDEAQLILAVGQTIVIGDLLVSNGDGTVKLYVPLDITDVYGTVTDKVYGHQIIGQAIEAVTTTSATARIQSRIM